MSIRTRRVVLLIGWTGHSVKHLRKYGDMYESIGFQPLLYSKHSWHLIGTNAEKELDYARDVLNLLRAEKAVGVHAISNGGAWVLADALQLAIDESSTSEGSPLPSLRRVVLDSAPGQFYLSDIPNGINFLWAMADQGSFARRLSLKAAFLICSIPFGFVGLLYYFITCKFLATNNMTTAYWGKLLRGAKALEQGSTDVRHLLLFSTDDKLVPAQHVRSFGKAMSGERTSDLRVTMREWECSEHAAHLRKHPEEYKELIRGFMNDRTVNLEASDISPRRHVRNRMSKAETNPM